MNSIKAAAIASATIVLAACGGGGGSGTNGAQSLSVGGSVTGLSGSGLTLSSNGQSLVVGADGTFVFSAPIASGPAYDVSVATQPESPAQDCEVSNGAGALTNANANANINNIAVTCAPMLPLAVTNGAGDNALVLNFSSALDAATVSTSTATPSNSIAGRQEIDFTTTVFDASGDAVAVWSSYDDNVNNIRANRFE